MEKCFIGALHISVKVQKSEMCSIRRFEDLPNKILLEYLKYLNALNLFYSFDDLNKRFCKLIRSTNLHLNFENVTKTRQDSLINEKIISLDLSDERSFDESDQFLLNYCIEEFPHLKYLSLTNLKDENEEKFLLMLSSMPEVFYFYFNVADEQFFYPPNKISIGKLKRLKIPSLLKRYEIPKENFGY